MNKDEIYAGIGRRIRQLRTSAGLTQEKLCDGYITRNMLSRIETGNACPSIDTLLYFAEKLKVSPAYFLCLDNGEQEQFDKISRVKDARTLYSAGRYDKCAAMLRGERDDEEALMLSLSEGKLAVSALDKSAVGSAVSHIERAREALNDTVYMQSELSAELSLLRAVCKAVCGEAMPSSKTVAGTSFVLMGAARHSFLLGVALFRENDRTAASVARYLPEKSVYRICLEAAGLIDDGRCDEALVLLDSAHKGSHGALCSCFIYEKLEVCCRELGDFKAAYEMSVGRRALIENFKKQL